MVTHCSTLAWRISKDRGAWRATVHGVTKSRTRLSNYFHCFLEAAHLALICAQASDSWPRLGDHPRENLVFCLAQEELLPGCLIGTGTWGMNFLLHCLPIGCPLLRLYIQGHLVLSTPEPFCGPWVQCTCLWLPSPAGTESQPSLCQ